MTEMWKVKLLKVLSRPSAKLGLRRV